MRLPTPTWNSQSRSWTVTRRSGRACRIWESVNAWDFWTAVAVAAAACVIMLASSRDLESTGAHAAAAISGGVSLVVLDLVALRWLSDRMKDSEYGELVRTGDTDEVEVSLPYWIVAVSGMVTAALGFIGTLVDGELPRPGLLAYWTGLILVAAYALLGSFSLLRLTLWHQRQHASLQASRERAARQKRQNQRSQGASGSNP